MQSAAALARVRAGRGSRRPYLRHGWSRLPIDRRELANRADLGLTEAQVRGAIRTLERISFLDRITPDRGSRYQRRETGDLHRKPVPFRLGLDYRAAFETANKRAQKARGRRGHERRPTFTQAQAPRPSVASPEARPLKSPKFKSEADRKVFMGELTPKPPEATSLNSKLEAALEQWRRAAEGQGWFRSGQ